MYEKCMHLCPEAGRGTCSTTPSKPTVCGRHTADVEGPGAGGRLAGSALDRPRGVAAAQGHNSLWGAEDHLKVDKEGPSPSNEPGKPCWCLFRKILCLKKKAQHRVSEKLFRKIGQIIHQNLHLTRREAPKNKDFGFRGASDPPNDLKGRGPPFTWGRSGYCPLYKTNAQ